MGGNQSNIAVIDPNASSAHKQQYAQIEDLIKKAFKQASENGKLKRDKFNEALSILENLNLRRIRDTPLSDRLFSVIDTDQNGYIDEAEYQSGLTQMINDKEKRILYSFKIIDKDGDGRVSRQEFYDFFKESWICAFRLLGERVAKGPNRYGMNLSKINQWSQGQLNALHGQVNILFSQLDPKQSGFLDFQYFRQWAISNDANCIRAVFDNEEVQVPLHLYKLEISR